MRRRQRVAAQTREFEESMRVPCWLHSEAAPAAIQTEMTPSAIMLLSEAEPEGGDPIPLTGKPCPNCGKPLAVRGRHFHIRRCRGIQLMSEFDG